METADGSHSYDAPSNFVDEFLIRSVESGGSLAFLRRIPPLATEPIQEFTFRIVGVHSYAEGQVYAGDGCSALVELFEEMASRWMGWPGELGWQSLESELILQCTHDRFGHITIKSQLSCGFYREAWQVDAAIVTEAGQLADIAERAKQFFGNTTNRGMT